MSFDIQPQNLSTEIKKLKNNLPQANNLKQQDLTKHLEFPFYTPTTKHFDPVEQIRRYHELKEDGIITEEEFERKKKQLLEL